MPAQLILYTSGTGCWLLLQTRHGHSRTHGGGSFPPTRTLVRLRHYHSITVRPEHLALHRWQAVLNYVRFDAEKALQLITCYRITHMMAVPTMLHRIRAPPPEVVVRYDVSLLTYSPRRRRAPHSLKSGRSISWL
ncbi:MAG: hypothetical protein QM813_16310 [Verrucomicrobiota bacterium]